MLYMTDYWFDKERFCLRNLSDDLVLMLEKKQDFLVIKFVNLVIGNTGVNAGFSKPFLNLFDGCGKLVSFATFSPDVVFVLIRTR